MNRNSEVNSQVQEKFNILKNRLLKHNLPVSARWPMLKIDKFDVQNRRVVNKQNRVNLAPNTGNGIPNRSPIFVKLKRHVIISDPDDVTFGYFGNFFQFGAARIKFRIGSNQPRLIRKRNSVKIAPF